MKKRITIRSSIILALALLLTASLTQIILGAPELSKSPDAPYEIELYDLWNDDSCDPFAPCKISIDGPSIAKINTLLTFTAYVSPEDALLPITYTWVATDISPIVHTSGISDSVELSWATGGWKQISVKAENSKGDATVFFWFYIEQTITYLPLIIR